MNSLTGNSRWEIQIFAPFHRESIVRHLGIPDGLGGVISDVPLPDNLLLTVSKDENRDAELLALLRSDEFINSRSIIVYCGRRDECNRVADYIRTCMQDLQSELTSSADAPSTSRKRKRPKQIVESYHAGLPGNFNISLCIGLNSTIFHLIAQRPDVEPFKINL